MPLSWFIIVFAVQPLLCKLLFLRTGGGKFIVINNRLVSSLAFGNNHIGAMKCSHQDLTAEGHITFNNIDFTSN